MQGKLSALLSGAGALTFLFSAAAWAQSPATNSDDEEIVVTGTSIRGIAPAGAQTLGFGEDDIEAIGATTTAQLMANVPQIGGYFNETPTLLGNNTFQLTINRPALRGLSGGGNADSTSASSTLLLMDGRRLVPSGIRQTAPDADVIPPSVLRRLEIVPDGGSSIYGADAVGGVINYITLNRFDGAQIDARAGFADEYWNSDFTLTVGDDWGSGSAFIAYNNSQRDNLYGRERDFIQKINWVTGVPTDRQCATPNISTNMQDYTLTAPGGTPIAGITACDFSDDVAYYPQENKESAFGRLSQELNDRITFDLQAYYSLREDKSDGGPLRGNANIPDGNPFHLDSLGAGTQTVQFSYEPLLGRRTPQYATNEVWQITPSISVDLGNDWQLRSFLSYGRSHTSTLNYGINTTAQSTAAASSDAASALNPYDLSQTASGVIGSILDWRIYGDGEQELTNAKAIFDGPLFSMPGGEIRVAVGAEWIQENYESQSGEGRVSQLSSLPIREGDRDVYAVFGEINVPIVGPQNNLPGVNALSINLAARLDDYSDFGETVNPRVGVSYEPVEWLNLRGAWGESFQAPSLADVSAAVTEIATPKNVALAGHPSFPIPPNNYRLFLTGSVAGLQPQTATTWSAGFDVEPPFVPNLEFSATYYSIEFENLLSRALPLTASYYTNFPSLYIINPTPAQIDAAIVGAINETTARNTLSNDAATPVYAIYDARVTNLGRVRTSGIDAALRYQRDTDFGSLYFNLSGNYILNRQSALSSTAPYAANTARERSRLNLSATVGTTIGEHFVAQATINHRGGYDVTPAITNNFQDEVDAFNVVNLYFQYDFLGEGLTQDLSLSLGINNVFDEDPPLFQGSSSVETHGYANGFTLGRLFQVGLTKRF